MSDVRRGTVLSFNSSDWTALVMLDGADSESQVPVGQWVPSAMMTLAAEVAVLVFGGTNTDDAVVLGPYGAVSQWDLPATGGAANGALLIGNGAGMALATLTGTANQVTVTNGAGSVTLSGPQDLASASSPTFALVTGKIADAGTNTATVSFSAQHRSSGTPAAGFGSHFEFKNDDDGKTLRQVGLLTGEWASATSASRKGRVRIFAADSSGVREGLRVESSGAAALIAFYGGAAAAKQTVTGSRAGNAALASLLSALSAIGLVTDSSSA